MYMVIALYNGNAGFYKVKTSRLYMKRTGESEQDLCVPSLSNKPV